ncbi:MAG: flagellar FliJ family protein [Acidobacteria bacterium]|nr:flagellar FliJ family protein [Acidobacteriota bacterium]
MAAKKYRLEPVLGAREQSKREAERLLAARVHQLAEAEEELARRLGAVEACRARQAAARAEELEALKAGAAAARALAHRTHLADLRAQEETLRAAAEEQRGAVARCEAELERARAALVEAAREVRVIEKHKENWRERERREAVRREQKLNDEIGAILHERRSSD